MTESPRRCSTPLGKQLEDVPGAPGRCGSFIAFLAARAWHEAHPGKGPADLIAASADEIWGAFVKGSGIQ